MRVRLAHASRSGTAPGGLERSGERPPALGLKHRFIVGRRSAGGCCGLGAERPNWSSDSAGIMPGFAREELIDIVLMLCNYYPPRPWFVSGSFCPLEIRNSATGAVSVRSASGPRSQHVKHGFARAATGDRSLSGPWGVFQNTLSGLKDRDVIAWAADPDHPISRGSQSFRIDTAGWCKRGVRRSPDARQMSRRRNGNNRSAPTGARSL